MMENNSLYDKCAICHRKVMTIGSQCRCQQYVCAKHKSSHSCSYDYSAEQRAKIQKENPIVIKNKISSI